MIVQGYIQANFDWRSIVDSPSSLKDKIVKVYLLAKEGFSNPKILGEKSIPLNWTKEAIYSLASKVKIGIQAFLRHGKTNSIEGRTELGNLVGHAIKEIGGKLYHYVAIASKDDHGYDVISMEASLSYNDTNGIVTEVDNLSGLALGKKGVDIPGVEGAELVAQMQFFNEEIENTQTRKKEMATREEIKNALREYGGNITDFVNIGDILGKVEIKDGKLIFDGEGDPKIAKAIEKYIIAPTNEMLESQSNRLKEYEPIVAEHKDLKLKEERTSAKDKIAEIVKSRSLTEQHKGYLENELSGFDPSINKFEDFIENGLTKFKQLVDSNVIKLELPTGGLPKPESSDPDGAGKTWEEEFEETKEIK